MTFVSAIKTTQMKRCNDRSTETKPRKPAFCTVIELIHRKITIVLTIGRMLKWTIEKFLEGTNSLAEQYKRERVLLRGHTLTPTPHIFT